MAAVWTSVKCAFISLMYKIKIIVANRFQNAEICIKTRRLCILLIIVAGVARAAESELSSGHAVGRKASAAAIRQLIMLSKSSPLHRA